MSERLSAESVREQLPRTNPFNRYEWEERFVSLDGTEASDFTIEDVAEVVASGETGDQWDGDVAAVLRLKDGRFVSYETFYGPTGDGFSLDAYGGDADLKFGATLEVVQRLGLTDNGRRLCGWTPEQFDGSESAS
jgi:hypothetical protein